MQLAGYRIDGVVGRGGMGVVYRATELALDRPVALKLIAPSLRTIARSTSASCASRASRPRSIIPGSSPSRKAGEGGRDLYLATRYAPGRAPIFGRSWPEAGTLPPERALAQPVRWPMRLDAAHGRRARAPRRKPGNVLVDASDHCYLCDFGLTKQLGDGGTTASGLLAGSLDYLAPEQIRRGKVDGRTDEYALACVLYECLSGAPPFRRDTEAQTLWAHMQEQPSSLPPTPSSPPFRPRARQGSCRALRDLCSVRRRRPFRARPRPVAYRGQEAPPCVSGAGSCWRAQP